MFAQHWRAVWPIATLPRDARRSEAFSYAWVHGGVVPGAARAFLPCDRAGQPAQPGGRALTHGVAHACDLIMLHAIRGREDADASLVDDQWIRDGACLLQHPVQRDVGQSGFRFWIASADVGVVPREPHLHERLRFAFNLGAALHP